MPSRAVSFHGAGNGLVVAPRSLGDTNSNPFDKSFHEGRFLEDWDSWMAWGGAAPELLPAPVERRESTASTISSPEGPWALGRETSMDDNMETSYAAVTGLLLEDAPFEFYETPLTPASPTAACYSSQSQVQAGPRRPSRGFPSPTAAGGGSSRDSATPCHALPKIETASTATSPLYPESVSPSPSPHVRSRQNQCKSADQGDQPSTLGQSRKRGHNAIEKRYRTNLNAKIECLRRGVPSLRGSEDSDGEAVERKPGRPKHGKGAILTRALDYIRHLESTAQRLGGEVGSLKSRVEAFEKLASGGSLVLPRHAVDMLSRPLSTRTETLERIQSDFQQMKPKVAKSAVKPPARRKGTRQPTT
ncbi:hypothetical protein PZA11_000223 [Diplocarpon coronariae]|uniref:BHLH domain-containing protein n=1 Tax=Diplocarpon coronariae TaxID=2795749 RepID=A0A218Z2L4_9HELO|nr:sterol regulatory element binding protein Sre1 [Diplocarpon mali]OWP01486.1 hypothetical protein B2J93_718 [Marssonina coronariae]